MNIHRQYDESIATLYRRGWLDFTIGCIAVAVLGLGIGVPAALGWTIIIANWSVQ